MRLTFAHPWLLAIACGVLVVAIGVGIRRRLPVSRVSGVMGIVALILFALAAGGVSWHRPASSEVVVMVDYSASTRGAAYRDAKKLDARLRELVGDVPYRVVYFAQNQVTTPPGGDLTGERTRFEPPAAAAVVLFSDGRFEMSQFTPPVFAVIDPGLADAVDAAVQKMQTRGNEIVVTVKSDAGRQLSVDGAATPIRQAHGEEATVTIDGGPITLTRPIASGRNVATARFVPGDLWPENDALSLPLAPPMNSAKWVVTRGGAAPAGFVMMTPANLPSDAAAYLAPAIIVLDNVAAEELSGAQMPRLAQYVRDLGGMLVIGGGDRAFASGGYTGTALDAISPLASEPPTPATHWMLLADASGSMSAGNRWQQAAGAIARLIPQLPAEDPVSVGGFAKDISWWSAGRSAKETALLGLPPAVSPAGPTNLTAALEQIAAQDSGGLPAQLLVITDTDVMIEQGDALAKKLADRKIRLHILAISEERGIAALETLAKATGGSLRRQLDPAKWANEVREMMAAASPNRLIATAAQAKYAGELAALGQRSVSPWNRTWLKKDATLLAQARHGGEDVPLAARWNVGAGEVVAAGFGLSSAEVEAIGAQFARPPRDPRFAVTWSAAGKLSVRVEAAKNDRALNGLALSLEIASELDLSRPARHALVQTAPGRYELSIDAPRSRGFGAVVHEGRVIDRIAVAGRYAPEFDAIGIDYDALRRLANRSGGKVIDSATKGPIAFAFPSRQKNIAPAVALAGAMVLALGLAVWRRG